MKLLIVEDYQKINNLLTMFATQDNHEVKQARSAEEALELLAIYQFDAILLDLMLPDMQGEQLLSKIKAISDIYIMVISAKVDVQGRIDVISLGADDYVVKPFSVEEVMAKLLNIEKRFFVNETIIRTFNDGDLQINTLSREVSAGNHKITLTKKEYDVLWYLVNHHNMILSREAILEHCFKDSNAFDRVIDAFIKNIRKKIDEHCKDDSYIKTHYGIGYQFIGILDG